jgi:hypothetical protein
VDEALIHLAGRGIFRQQALTRWRFCEGAFFDTNFPGLPNPLIFSCRVDIAIIVRHVREYWPEHLSA